MISSGIPDDENNPLDYAVRYYPNYLDGPELKNSSFRYDRGTTRIFFLILVTLRKVYLHLTIASTTLNPTLSKRLIYVIQIPERFG